MSHGMSYGISKVAGCCTGSRKSRDVVRDLVRGVPDVVRGRSGGTFGRYGTGRRSFELRIVVRTCRLGYGMLVRDVRVGVKLCRNAQAVRIRSGCSGIFVRAVGSYRFVRDSGLGRRLGRKYL